MITAEKSECTRDVIRFILNLLCRFGLGGVITFCVWMGIQHYHYWFSWHVILCTLGYVPLMAEAIMLFTGDEIWSRHVSRKTRNIVHGYLMLLSTVTFMAGNIVLMYYSKKEHFSTAHGITGLVSMIAVLVSIVVGYFAHNPDLVKAVVKPVWVKFAHNILGLMGYIVGIISLCYAYYTHWWIYYTEAESRLAILILTIIATAWTINGALSSAYQQIKSIIR